MKKAPSIIVRGFFITSPLPLSTSEGVMRDGWRNFTKKEFTNAVLEFSS